MMNVESINAFYNAVAGEYNGHMTDADRKVRETVRDIFTRYVPSGNVLDFGGGTGLDLPWLLKRDYRIYFLEPSINMRSIASKNNPAANALVFMEKNTDFNKWSENHLPFHEKINGVLANFAVLNCFENLADFFEKIALVTARGAYIIATVIDFHPRNIVKKYSFVAAFKLLYQSQVTVHNRYKDVYHKTYIHSGKSFARAAATFYSLKSVTHLEFSDFAIVIFQKK